MAILPVYLYGSDILRDKAAEVKTMTDGLRKFIDDMKETMHAAEAIGLAANQVGKSKRIIVCPTYQVIWRYGNDPTE